MRPSTTSKPTSSLRTTKLRSVNDYCLLHRSGWLIDICSCTQVEVHFFLTSSSRPLCLFLFYSRPAHVMFFHMPQLVFLLPSTIQSPLGSHTAHPILFNLRPWKDRHLLHISHAHIHIFIWMFSVVLLSFRMRPTGPSSMSHCTFLNA